jgi:tetratricopeptide (TPR) repeat protein
MDPGEIDALVKRLVANPHDEESLASAHRAGAADPKAYASLLEKLGAETEDPVYASHWLSEAANVWSTTLGDAHRAARVLMMAVDKDPTQQVAANRLAQLYRDKGDVKALVAMLDRRARLLTPLLSTNEEMRGVLAGLHEELGKLWSEPPLAQPKKAIENYRRAIELDAASVYAIYSVREIYKGQGQWSDAIAMYAMELAIEQDPARRLALLRDEAVTRKAAGDLPGATRALMQARELDAEDPAIAQELAGSVLDRLQGGEPVPAVDRNTAAELLVGLAEVYDGEHGLAYASGALDAEPGHDRALQLYSHYARMLQREEQLSSKYLAYVEANPKGAMAPEARQSLAASYEGAGDLDRAAAILEPLRASGGHEVAQRLDDLYARGAARPAPTRSLPPGMPSVPPPLGGRGSRPPPPLTASFAPRERDRDRLQALLDDAQTLASSGKKPEALAKYKEVLEADPGHSEALSWVEEYLRSKRDYAQLRDALWAAARAMSGHDSIDAKKERLREIAGLCEGNLRDIDGAVNAFRQLLTLDRADEGAHTALARVLEKAQRWDDLALLHEQEANVASDIDSKIQLEKKLAVLHETKRKDFGAAAEAWARICDMAPDDERALETASTLFEKAGKLDMAAQVILDHASGIDDATARAALLERLGGLRERLGDLAGAGEAYKDAAAAQPSAKTWETAERCFAEAEKWEEAAKAAIERAGSADPKQQAEILARASEHLLRAGDEDGAVARLEQATELDPTVEAYARALCDRYEAAEQWDRLSKFLSHRGDQLTDKAMRLVVRRQAATMFAERLKDKDAAREQWLKVLEDGDDREALEKLIDDAVEREDYTEATTLLRRLGGIAVDKADKARVALREAELFADGIGDIDTAVARYEAILRDLDPACRPALQAIADLQETRDNPEAAVDALERELKLLTDLTERGQIAARLARLYESLDDPKNAIRALDVVRKADPDDFDALARLEGLCEQVEQWDRVAELLAQRVEVEGDEHDASEMTRKLAAILADRLDRGDEALAALTEFADQGNPEVRTAYVELGDRLGWKGIVASKLVEWWADAKASPERTGALRGAFERFCDVGREGDAIRVAIEVVRSKGADHALAERLEQLAVKAGDHDALSTGHDLLARDLSGAERAIELIRQAEVRVKAGMPPEESIQHGEAGLTSVAPGDAEPLLERLAALAPLPADVIDLYERQVSRAKAPTDRVKALGRAAQIAATKGDFERARSFFDLGLIGAPTEEILVSLEEAAAEADDAAKSDRLRRTLAAAMGGGGQGARDGGRSRSALLRRAATIAHRDLGDLDQAFTWLGDALIAHVEASSLDALDELAQEINDPARAEETISRALAEVFDGPLVRQLLARRSKIRREQMSDKAGAAADLRKLHDLSPSDQAIMDDLTSLLMELGDYRSMVQVYEDQLLRGKDMTARSELARKVARMWEEQLEDPREAADAWRRVLRMKAGDVEATTGLERAKSTMLKKPDPDAVDAYAPPKLGPPGTVMPPPPRAPSATPSGSPQAPPSEPKEDPVVDAQAKDGEAPVPEMGEDVDTPIPGVEEDLDTGESAAEGEAQDSEAPAPPDVAPAAPFAGVDLAFAQITITTEQKPNPAAPSSEPLIPGDESSGLDLSDLDDPAPVATSSGPSLPEPPRSGPAEEGDILVIDDIAEELEDLDAGAAPPDSNESAPARASSVPPPLPRQ